MQSHSFESATYMDGTSVAFRDLADTVLLVDGACLLVHRTVLAANSTTFAELFAVAITCQSLSTGSKLEIPLLGDNLLDVHTSLNLYKGITLSKASSLDIQSPDEAQSLVRFAHKYDIHHLWSGCEDYLMQLAQEDLAVVVPEVKKLFTSTQATVSWTALAEDCELDRFGAHCELFMIRSRDTDLWQHPAFLSESISRECMMRMLRGLQAFKNQSEDCYRTVIASIPTLSAVDRNDMTIGQRLNPSNSDSFISHVHADVNTILNW